MHDRDLGEGVIRFDAIEIDAKGHRLRVGGVEVPLERKAFAVLVLLAGQPGRVFTRDEILNEVWGHAHVTPGVLNRVMTLLRQALGETADAHRYLNTVHGVGYRFDRPADVPARTGTEVEPASVIEGNPDATGEPSPSLAEPVSEDGTGLAPPPEGQRSARRAVWMALVALLVIASIALWRHFHGVAPNPADEVAGDNAYRIAVLPFANDSGEEDQQFFSDGLSEGLISTLSQFDGLRMIGRGSSFQFRDNKLDARAIGSKLGATHLIDGSVRRQGDQVRIGVELVRTSDASTVWSSRYDRPYRDLFALQDEIALSIAGALQVNLLHAMPGAVNTGRPASGNLDAYNAYLRGTYVLLSDARKAIDAFSEATRIDPTYAQAWSWLGFERTQYARESLSGDAARASYAQAREDIETALRLAPDFGQAHAIRANLMAAADHDWFGALAEFQTALALVSDTDPTHGAVSRLLSTLGRINEAIEERRKYIAGDSLAAFARIHMVNLLASVGQLDGAEANLRMAIELDPDNADWYAAKASYLAILRGDANTAIVQAERLPTSRLRDRTLAQALQIGEDRRAADAALQRLLAIDGQVKGDAYALALVYALRGDADKTFEWLDRDWERGDAGVHDVLFQPILMRFRDDPRFAGYCRVTGLPPPSKSEALSIDRIRLVNSSRH